MSEELIKKLKYKPGRSYILHAPEGFSLDISTESTLEHLFDFILFFVRNADEAREELLKMIPHATVDCKFWLAYPKQNAKLKTNINRDILFRLVQEISAYTIVANVAIDETWSALRLRPKQK
jgi:hypothetical protein